MAIDRLPPSLTMWAIQALFALAILLIGFTSSREFARNDDQEIRIRCAEQAIVEIKYIRDDVRDIKRMMVAPSGGTYESN